MSNGEWTILEIFIGVLVGIGVYNTLVLSKILRIVSLPKTAKWIRAETNNPYDWAFRCSNCGEVRFCGVDLYECEDDAPGTGPVEECGLFYCPHCGAKMEKGESLRQ